MDRIYCTYTYTYFGPDTAKRYRGGDAAQQFSSKARGGTELYISDLHTPLLRAHIILGMGL